MKRQILIVAASATAAAFASAAAAVEPIVRAERVPEPSVDPRPAKAPRRKDWEQSQYRKRTRR